MTKAAMGRHASRLYIGFSSEINPELPYSSSSYNLYLVYYFYKNQIPSTSGVY